MCIRDRCKGIVDTRNMFVLKHLCQHTFLLWRQCGEKFIFRLVVLCLGTVSYTHLRMLFPSELML